MLRNTPAIMLLLCGMVIENTLGGVPSQPASMPALDTTALREAVSAYIDEMEEEAKGPRNFPSIVKLCDRLGGYRFATVILEECFRQASERKLELVLAELISYTSGTESFVKDAVLRGLTSSTPQLQRRAAIWCVMHADLVDDKAMADARKIVRKWASAPDSWPDRGWMLFAMMECATHEDIPLIRGLLESRKEHFKTLFPKYGCRTVLESGPCLPARYADFACTLCRIGDSAPLYEVAEALTQTEDPEKRAWGILMAARLWPNGFYATAVANALSDKAIVPVPAVVGPPPGVSTQVARLASVQSYVRVCDVAVRAVFAMEPPKKPWPFDVPITFGWELSPRDVKPNGGKALEEISDDGYDRTMSGVVTIRRTIGYSAERIQWTKDYALKNQEKRLSQAQSGAGPRIAVVGGEEKFVRALVQEYVRAGRVVKLVMEPASSDAAAIRAFLGDPPRDLLVLGDKPSARAMELYGKQWNALGRDANGGSTHSASSGQAGLTAGKPNGAGPAEYLLAGRAAAVIVNPANKIDALTIGQLQAIFGGEVEDWGTLGSTSLTARGDSKSQIKVYGLRSDDPATGIFEKECLDRYKWRRVVVKKDTAEAVAAVSMDPQAIGFVDLTAIPATGQNIKILAIKLGTGERAKLIQPTPENIKSAMYPLSQRLWLYVHPAASETGRAFAAFVTSVLPMDTYRKHGLVPLADAALLRMSKDAMAEAAAKAKAEAAKPKGKGKGKK